MRKIIELTVLTTLFFSFVAQANQVKVDKASFVKCAKGSDCNFKIKINDEKYTIVSSPDTNLNLEIQNIYEELDKENAKESKPFCVTGKIISIKSKKMKESSFFKISSIGAVQMKRKKLSPSTRYGGHGRNLRLLDTND